MAKFKKGDRVRVLSNRYGITYGDYATVLEDNSTNPLLRLDNRISLGHDSGGLCERGYGIAIFENNLELIADSKQPTTITLILGNTAYEITGENITIKTKQL